MNEPLLPTANCQPASDNNQQHTLPGTTTTNTSLSTHIIHQNDHYFIATTTTTVVGYSFEIRTRREWSSGIQSGGGRITAPSSTWSKSTTWSILIFMVPIPIYYNWRDNCTTTRTVIHRHHDGRATGRLRCHTVGPITTTTTTKQYEWTMPGETGLSRWTIRNYQIATAIVPKYR